MRNGLELNSITYGNPQTNKSNIAQGQNAFYVTGSKTKEQAIKKISHIFTAYSISELFPVKLYDSLSVAWKHLSVAEPPALTSGVKVSQALPVCGFSQDPLPVGMSAPLLSPHQLRMLLLPSKSFLKPEEKIKKKRIAFHAGVTWCEKRNVIKYCCFVYLTQFYKLPALWLVPICGCEDASACGEWKVHEENHVLRRVNTRPTFPIFQLAFFSVHIYPFSYFSACDMHCKYFHFHPCLWLLPSSGWRQCKKASSRNNFFSACH